MGFMDKIKQAVGSNAGKAEGAVGKAAGMVDRKTGGKYTDKIDQATDKGLDAADKLDGKVDRQAKAKPTTERREP